MNDIEYEIMYLAEDRHWWYVSLHALILHFISEEHRSKGRLNILDAGCGTGRLCQLMAQFGTVHGCDVSDHAVSFCKKRHLPSIVRADLNTASLGHARYDIITSIDVLYHKSVEDEARVLKKIHAALRPGGLLILQVPAYEFLRSSHDAAVHTRRRYTASSVAGLLRAADFSVERITYRVAALFPSIALYRMIRKITPLPKNSAKARSDVKTPASVLNSCFLALTRMENRFLARRSLPFGTSVFAVARKPH